MSGLRPALCRLERSILVTAGPDAGKFLQGLASQDLRRIVPRGALPNTNSPDPAFQPLPLNGVARRASSFPVIAPRHGVPSLFLSSKGRIIADTFIVNASWDGQSDVPPEQPVFLIDCHRDAVDALYEYLDLRTLVADVSLERSEEWTSMHLLPPSESGAEPSKVLDDWLGQLGETASNNMEWIEDRDAPGCDDDVAFVIADRRCPRMGFRILSSKTGGDRLLQGGSDVEEYHLRCREVGIPEGPRLLGASESAPFKFNLDMLDYVSLRKGCFVGQELLARTHYTGSVRRRLFPFQLADTADEVSLEDGPFTVVDASNGKRIGDVVEIIGSKGMALIASPGNAGMDLPEGMRRAYGVLQTLDTRLSSSAGDVDGPSIRLIYPPYLPAHD